MGVPHHGSDGNLSQGDIERFCPEFAVISARGDSSHPSRAIVSGLVKVGAKVASTHRSGNLWFWSGSVPYRADYGAVELLKGTGEPEAVIDWVKILSGTR
jgi:beta-lactamase superfamily II metal-dependent hydrolase